MFVQAHHITNEACLTKKPTARTSSVARP